MAVKPVNEVEKKRHEEELREYNKRFNSSNPGNWLGNKHPSTRFPAPKKEEEPPAENV